MNETPKIHKPSFIEEREEKKKRDEIQRAPIPDRVEKFRTIDRGIPHPFISIMPQPDTVDCL